jgi:AcrR family transcriptional regulator
MMEDYMSLYQLQREQIKDNILKTAIRIFREKGYDKVSVSEIGKKDMTMQQSMR